MYETTVGGFGRAVGRHIERRGSQTRPQLFDHFCGYEGSHGWSPENLDRGISELIDAGLAADDDGVICPVVVPPL